MTFEELALAVLGKPLQSLEESVILVNCPIHGWEVEYNGQCIECAAWASAAANAIESLNDVGPYTDLLNPPLVEVRIIADKPQNDYKGE